ncbi:MAG: ABC transporter ATP-binding protein [Geminicoccaceae bacterium]
MARVVLDKVNKIYPSAPEPVHAVKDLSLDVEDGEFVALLGPSGCGKSSTLRMIVGLEDISGGTISFDGVPVNDLAPEQRNVAMAFETYALYPNFTVAQNLSFPLEVKGIDADTRQRRVMEVARLLRIEPILESRPGQLSGGQQQRVSLGRALIRDPAAFILDEVMSHLDAHLKFQMLFELKKLHQDIGKTMIYVTHDQMEALALADRVAVMSNAELQQFGNRDQLYNQPKNTFVADFIGEPPTNFLSGRWAEGGGDAIAFGADGASQKLVPDARRRQALRERGLDEVTVGIRPQNLFVHGRDGADQSIDVVVDIDEYVGEASILTVKAGGELFRAVAPPDFTASEGDRIKLYYRQRDVMIFDTQAGDFIG